MPAELIVRVLPFVAGTGASSSIAVASDAFAAATVTTAAAAFTTATGSATNVINVPLTASFSTADISAADITTATLPTADFATGSRATSVIAVAALCGIAICTRTHHLGPSRRVGARDTFRRSDTASWARMPEGARRARVAAGQVCLATVRPTCQHKEHPVTTCGTHCVGGAYRGMAVRWTLLGCSSCFGCTCCMQSYPAGPETSQASKACIGSASADRCKSQGNKASPCRCQQRMRCPRGTQCNRKQRTGTRTVPALLGRCTCLRGMAGGQKTLPRRGDLCPPRDPRSSR